MKQERRNNMPTKEFTGYRDSQGQKVYIGDKIEFLFWLPSVAGTPIEHFYIGRIRKRKGHLVFAYKPDGTNLSERRLTNLNFASEADWTLITG